MTKLQWSCLILGILSILAGFLFHNVHALEGLGKAFGSVLLIAFAVNRVVMLGSRT